MQTVRVEMANGGYLPSSHKVALQEHVTKLIDKGRVDHVLAKAFDNGEVPEEMVVNVTATARMRRSEFHADDGKLVDDGRVEYFVKGGKVWAEANHGETYSEMLPLTDGLYPATRVYGGPDALELRVIQVLNPLEWLMARGLELGSNALKRLRGATVH